MTFVLLLWTILATVGPGAASAESAAAATATLEPAAGDASAALRGSEVEAPSSVETIVREARALAASSPRVTVEEMGRSAEGDPLLLLVITAEGNRSRLADRSSRMARLEDPSLDRKTKERIAEECLAGVWVIGSVHGDEASGADAALELARRLATGESEETRSILDNTVVLINPCANPDGRRRFLQHLRTATRPGGGDPDEEAVEHRQFWPGGRTNHWFFDLNRDWALLTQPESRAQVAAYLRWRPQVVIDLHEMGSRSSYYFPPPAQPVNPQLPSALQRWLKLFGRANAAAFDRAGLDYYVGEDFDLFYPGYGDSWPSLTGAVGMTYEQATSRGLRIRTPTGAIRGYPDAVHGHLTAAWATCRTAAAHRRDLLLYHAAFFESALQQAGREKDRELVIDGSVHPAEAGRLARVLAAQGIEVWRTLEAADAKLRPLEGGPAEGRPLPEGSFRIPLRQPSYPLLMSLLEPELPLDPGFLEEERQRHQEGLRARFYDVTSWSLALSYGVAVFRSPRSLEVESERVTPGEFAASGSMEAVPATDPRAGPPRSPGSTSPGSSAEASADYGYLVPYRDHTAAAALADLWNRKVRVHATRDAFRQGEVDFPAGSLVVKRSAQPEGIDLDAVMTAVAARTGAPVIPTGTAWTQQGPSLGSHRVGLLRPPRVAVVVGPPTRATSAGALLWVFQEEIGLSCTAVRFDRLGQMPLRRWDVIVLPDLEADAVEVPAALEDWVELGGTLVAEAGAVEFLLQRENWLKARLVEDLQTPTEGAAEDSVAASSAPDSPGSAARPGRAAGSKPEKTPGAILRLSLARHHVLCFGSKEPSQALVLSDRLLEAGEGDRVAATYDEVSPRRAGFVWPEMEEALAGRVWALSEIHGKGKVILFAEEPAFRGSWPETTRMLLNAVMWSPSLLH